MIAHIIVRIGRMKMNNTLLPVSVLRGEAKLHDGVVVIPVIDENGAY